MKYEIILFDADETLFDFKKTERYALEKTFEHFAIPYEASYHLEIYGAINKKVWEDLEKGLITPDRLKVERFKRLSEKLALEFDPREFSDAYLQALGEGSFLLKGADKLVEALSKDYRMGILTNGLSVVQNNRIKQSVLKDYFEAVVISEEVKVAKPNAQIFDMILSQMGQVDRTRVLMIGDSLTSDIQGGINAGIDTCWYNPHQVKNTTGIQPMYEVCDFEALRQWLEV
ncbi:MAG: YjjG family noncanonical pyrimidine nucleotidase [Niameybacter sp.]|uniref:YjjG family noncanonical pyrimidine nucleotidase n=1 Tax=Niameybacter sp. TaxID=2033640 RepID=UPI002FC62C38